MQELIGLMLFALISRDCSSRVVPVKVGSDPRNDPLSVTWNGAHTSNYSAMWIKGLSLKAPYPFRSH